MPGKVYTFKHGLLIATDNHHLNKPTADDAAFFARLVPDPTVVTDVGFTDEMGRKLAKFHRDPDSDVWSLSPL